MLTVPEKTRLQFLFVPEDEEREEFTPDTLRYRLHEPVSDTELIPWTSFTINEPGALATDRDPFIITIPSTANRMLNTSNAYEARILTVQSDHDTDDQLSADFEYRVRNLSGFT